MLGDRTSMSRYEKGSVGMELGGVLRRQRVWRSTSRVADCVDGRCSSVWNVGKTSRWARFKSRSVLCKAG